MKINVTIEIDTETGDYELTYNSKEEVEQTWLAKVLARVVENWNMKFKN